MPPADSTTRALEARRVRGIQVAVVLAVLFSVLRATPLTRELFIFPLIENPAYDALFDSAAPEPPPDIVIVEIDERSLRELGRFQSWHRDRYAQLLDRLSGARVVAIDVLFPEPDESWCQEQDGGGMTADQALAGAMRRHGRVVLASHWQEDADPPDAEALAHLQYVMDGHGRLARSAEGLVLSLPVPELAAEAVAVGFVNLWPDRDGVHRRFRPAMVGPGRAVAPHFGLAVAAVASGADGREIMADIHRNRYGVGGPQLFLDNGGSTLINYCGPTGTIPRVSFADVLKDDAVAAGLRDKIVFVGATAPGLYDIRPAPYRTAGRRFYGVETHANITANALYRDPLRDVSDSHAWCAVALVLGLLAGLAVWTRGPLAYVSAGLLAVVATCSFWVAFRLWGLWIPYGAVLPATVLPVAVGVYTRLTMERQLIQRQFDAYVSHQVLQDLMEHPDLIRASRSRTVTLLFADVRGSTALSEHLPPEVWVAQLNEYLTQMSEAIFQYDGYLDKFMGDGIMAVWNAFGTQEENHAELGVRAAQQMLQRLELLNRRWEQMPDRTPLRIGIGLHSGEAVMGNVGSEDRTQFTAIGDVVNTAARIEGMTKEKGCALIISDGTARLVQDLFPLRELGETPVRGRAGKVTLHEVIMSPRDAGTKEASQYGPAGEEEAGQEAD